MPPGEAAALRAYVETLPLDPPPLVPKGGAPDAFSWDNFDLGNGHFVSYVGPSTRSPGSHCWLYSEIHTLQVLYASRARQLGYQEPATPERGIWLNPHVYYDCADRREMPGLEQYCVADYGTHDYGLDDHGPPRVCTPVTRWNHEPWSESIGYVESCVQWPLPGVRYTDAKHSCGVCDRYRQTAPRDLPRFCECSWIQSSHPDETLLFRSTGAHRVDMSGFRDAGGNVVDPELMLETLATLLIVYGPMRVGFACPRRIPVEGVTNDLSAGQPVQWPRRVVDPDGPCAGEGHNIALIGYTKHDPDYPDPVDPLSPGLPSLTFQDFGRHGEKDVYKLPFYDFATPPSAGGAGGFGEVIYFPVGMPNGIRPPHPIRVGDPPPDPLVKPLRCDVDGDGVDGYENGQRVDNCPEAPNAEQLTEVDQADWDSDGVGDACDNCPMEPNPRQRDLDGDGWGDVCLGDMDGDGVLDHYDCDPTNPLLLHDTDGDGICEHTYAYRTAGWYRTACEGYCRDWGRQYFGCGEGYQACLARCDPAGGDNCADDLDNPAVQACADSRQSLASGGPPDPCCRDLFYNPDQADDAPADGVGDRCQTGALEVELQPPTASTWIGGLVKQCGDLTARVSFQASASTLDPAGEVRRGVSVESCWCPFVVGTGELEDWNQNLCRNRCPRTTRPAWNPINDHGAFGPYATAYPYGGSDPAQETFLRTNAMGRDREVTFRRSLAASRHELEWSWLGTKQYPKTLPFDPLYDVDEELATSFAQPRPLKVRVPWPAEVVGQDGAFGDAEVRLSRGVGYFTPPHVCGVRELPVWWARYWWVRGPWVTDRVRRDPSPVAYALIESDDAKVHVATFRDTLARPTDLREATYLPETSLRASLEGAATCSGKLDQAVVGLDPGAVSTVFAYRLAASEVGPGVEVGPPVTHPDDLPGLDPSGVLRATLWLGLVGRADNLWVTAEQALGKGVSAPVLTAAQLFFDSSAQALYLFGNEVGLAAPGARNVLHKLDLRAGAFTRIGPVHALRGAEGFSVSFDPASRQAVLFGGRVGGTETARAVLLDLRTGRAAELDLPAGRDLAVARADHGAFFDGYARKLYVYGGTRGDALLGDALVADLAAGWSRLADGGEGGPGARVRPLVLHQATTGRLWVASGSEHDPTPRLEPWELDLARLAWSARPSLTSLPPADPESRELVYSRDAPPAIDLEIDAGAPLSGELRLVEVLAADPGLGLEAYDDRGHLVATGLSEGQESRVALLGQPGQRYLLRLLASPSLADGRSVPFTLRDRAARLSLAGEITGLSGVTAAALSGRLAYVARSGGLSIFDLSSPVAPALVGALPLPGVVHDLAVCGPRHLCATSTPAHHALTVIDVQDTARPVISGTLRLSGQCRSLAVHGHRAYLACGPAGVAVADLMNPASPVLVDVLDVGGVSRRVVARRQLLVVYTSGPRRVRTFRLGLASSPVEMDAITPSRQVQAVYLNGDRLHLAEGSPGDWESCLGRQVCADTLGVEVYRVGWDALSLLREGEYAAAEAIVPLGRASGELIVVPVATGVRIYQAEPLP